MVYELSLKISCSGIWKTGQSLTVLLLLLHLLSKLFSQWLTSDKIPWKSSLKSLLSSLTFPGNVYFLDMLLKISICIKKDYRNSFLNVIFGSNDNCFLYTCTHTQTFKRFTVEFNISWKCLPSLHVMKTKKPVYLKGLQKFFSLCCVWK